VTHLSDLASFRADPSFAISTSYTSILQWRAFTVVDSGSFQMATEPGGLGNEAKTKCAISEQLLKVFL